MRCKAYRPKNAESWMPCLERVYEVGLCREHFDATAGVVLGMQECGDLDKQELAQLEYITNILCNFRPLVRTA